MRLTTVLFIASLMHVSAAGIAQKITLSERNATLVGIFEKIKMQTGYDFVADGTLLRSARPVTIHVKETELKEVLLQIFKDQQLEFNIREKMVVVSKKEPSFLDKASVILNSVQDLFRAIDVRGKIIGENDQVLAGATVKVKGTNTITKSNEKGEFYLAGVQDDAVLEISYIGFKALEIPVKGAVMPLEIKLNVATGELEEVKVTYSTGYQNIPKERATGSFERISNDAINQRITTDVLSRLEGVSSILFDKNSTRPPLTIRGFSSINISKNPLIILDNFPYEGNINNINPNDIESISILKDAAASSIWGARAGNGVIVITTKKGKFNQKTKLEFISNVTIIKEPDLSYLNPISSTDFIDVEKQLYTAGFYDNKINDLFRPALSPVVEILIRKSTNQISESEAETQINALRNIDVRDDFKKYMYQNAVNQQYALNLSGGTQNLSYILSGGYDRNTDQLSAGYNRANFRLQNTYRPLKNLTLSSALSITQSKTTSGKPSYDLIRINGRKLYPYAQFADVNGKSLPLYNNRQTYIDTAGAGKLLDWKYYPLEDYKHNTTTNNLQDLLANFGLEYKLGLGFKVDVKYQFEKQKSEQRNLKGLESFATRDLINTFSQIDKATQKVKYVVPKGDILDNQYQSLETHDFRSQINFDRTWNKHGLTGILGGELRSISDGNNGFSVYGYNRDILTSSNVDYVNGYPAYITSFESFIPNSLFEISKLKRYLSYYANAAYIYDSRYTISASARRDASNLFGVKTNDKWTPLWSVGTAWNISNESFYRSRIFPYLKLRSTFGYSANVDQSRSAVTTIRHAASAQITNLPFATVLQYGNPELRAEKVSMLNFGLDFQIFNVITGTLEYYRKKSADLFGRSIVDYTALPTTSVTANVAAMKGQGVDLNLEAKIINSNFKWLSGLFLSYNKSSVTKSYLTNRTGANYTTNGNSIIAVEGLPIYPILSFKSAGLDNLGNPQGFLNSEISTDYGSMYGSGLTIDDLVYSGSAIPTTYGSLNNTFTWKNFSLSASISYKFGYYFRKKSISYIDLAEGWNGHGDFSKRWKKTGDEDFTDIPSFIYPDPSGGLRDAFYTNSDALVERGDHVRLQYVNLSYSLNKSTWKSLPFTSLQLYITASNLGILWRANKEKLDPEYDQIIPPSKGFTFGLNASF